MVFDGQETRAQGKLPKVTVALMMCELSSHLASSFCVSLHTLVEAPLSPSTGLQPQLLRPSCFCKMELVGLQEQEAASANALALNTPMLTCTHTRWDLSLLVHLQQCSFPSVPIMPPALSLPPSEWLQCLYVWYVHSLSEHLLSSTKSMTFPLKGR